MLSLVGMVRYYPYPIGDKKLEERTPKTSVCSMNSYTSQKKASTCSTNSDFISLNAYTKPQKKMSTVSTCSNDSFVLNINVDDDHGVGLHNVSSVCSILAAISAQEISYRPAYCAFDCQTTFLFFTSFSSVQKCSASPALLDSGRSLSGKAEATSERKTPPMLIQTRSSPVFPDLAPVVMHPRRQPIANAIPFSQKVASRALVLTISAHFIVLISDITLLATTDSSEWNHQHIQAYGLFSLLIFMTNICVPLLVAAVLLKGIRALTLFASICVSWMTIGYIVVVLAYADFANLLESHPACSLTLITLLLMIVDAILLAVFNCSMEQKAKRRLCVC